MTSGWNVARMEAPPSIGLTHPKRMPVSDMRASANGMGRSPKNSLAADPNEAAAGAGGRPAPRGVKSPLDSSDVESAMKARQVAVTDGKSPLAERLAVFPTLGLGELRLEWRGRPRGGPPARGPATMGPGI